MRIEINEIVAQTRKPAWTPLADYDTGDQQQDHTADTEHQYDGDWNNLNANGRRRWDDVSPSGTWHVGYNGWDGYGSQRDHPDQRFRAGIPDTGMPDSFFNVDGTYDGEPDGGFFQDGTCDGATKPDGGFFQDGDGEPADGAHDPGELALTPTQFAATADQQQQRLATLDSVSKQQTDEIKRQKVAADEEKAKTAATFQLQSNASDATSALIAQLQQEQAAQQVRAVAMAATTDKLAADVATLGDVIKGQQTAFAGLETQMTALQSIAAAAMAASKATSVDVAGLMAKMDQLLSQGSRRDSAMGVGKDDDASSDAASSARKKVKNADGASATTA